MFEHLLENHFLTEQFQEAAHYIQHFALHQLVVQRHRQNATGRQMTRAIGVAIIAILFGCDSFNMAQQRKAVALISGGLDSLLAAKVIQEQGVYVEGINFFTGFCVEGHTHAIRNRDKHRSKRNNALWVAEQLGIKLHIIDISEEYKDVVINPKYGYGQHVNPCLDCKIFMVDKAKTWAWMAENNFDFVITGEVIGQRPKSQKRSTMPIIATESGIDDLLLRPLCAKHLPETKPEREGWVNREQLYAFHGRNRKPQIALARKFGFADFAQPAGGCCFLTDEHYASKLKDLWQARGERDYDLDDIMLLKVGRHLRPNERFKIMISREEGESNYLNGYRKSYTSIQPLSHTGALGLVDGKPNQEDLALAARIVARYSKGRNNEQVTLQVEPIDREAFVISTTPYKADEILATWYI